MSPADREHWTGAAGAPGLARAWRRFWSLSRAERGWICKALVLLPALRLGLRLVGYRTTQSALSRLLPAGNPGISSGSRAATRAESAAQAVRAAAGHGVVRATCLERSLATWWLLGRAGVPVQLRIGVRMERERLAAHAWVEYQGVPLAEAPDVSEHFAPFAAPLPGIAAFD